MIYTRCTIAYTERVCLCAGVVFWLVRHAGAPVIQPLCGRKRSGARRCAGWLACIYINSIRARSASVHPPGQDFLQKFVLTDHKSQPLYTCGMRASSKRTHTPPAPWKSIVSVDCGNQDVNLECGWGLGMCACVVCACRCANGKRIK